jgi:hypothetical protein
MMKFKGTIAAALAATLVLGSIAVSPAEARSRHPNRNNAAVAGAMFGLFGGLRAAAAADSYRDRYYDDGYRGYRSYRGPHYRGGYHGNGGAYVDPSFRDNLSPYAR